jgi:hypothetical protein
MYIFLLKKNLVRVKVHFRCVWERSANRVSKNFEFLFYLNFLYIFLDRFDMLILKIIFFILMYF